MKYKNKWSFNGLKSFNQNGVSGNEIAEFLKTDNYKLVNAISVNGTVYENITLKKHSWLSTVVLFNKDIPALYLSANLNVIFFEGYGEVEEPVIPDVPPETKKYSILKLEPNTYTNGENTNLELSFNNVDDIFQISSIRVGNNKISNYNDFIFTNSFGKVTVRILASYLDTLKAGSYKVTVNFKDNTNDETDLTIINNVKPEPEPEPDVIEWKHKERIDYIEITETIEQDGNKFEDLPDEVIEGTRGEIKTTWEEKNINGITTGEKRNERTFTTTEMIPKRIIKGIKKRPKPKQSSSRKEILQEILKQDYLQTDIRITLNDKTYDSSIFKIRPKIEKVTNKLFGDFIMTKCTFELNDRENKLDVLDKEVLIEKGVYINNTWTWYKLGYFIIKEINSKKSSLSIACTAYDRTILFNEKYSSNLDWNAKKTGLEIINEITQKHNVELEGTFAFSSYSFEKPNFKETDSERSVIARIAEIGGEHAYFNHEGNLVFSKPKTESIATVEGRHRTEYSLEKPDKKIGQISLGFEGYDDDYIVGENTPDEQTYRIENNPYCDLDRATIAPNIHDNIKGIQGRSYHIKEFIGAEHLNINDCITLKTNDGEEIKLIVLSIKTDGTIKGDIGADKVEYAEADYTIAGSVKEDLVKTKLEVNHIKNQITSAVNLTNEIKEEQSSIIQTAEEITRRIEETDKNQNEFTQKLTEITETINGINIKIEDTSGVNLIRNSAFSIEEYENNETVYPYWTTSSSSRVSTRYTSEVATYGAVSNIVATVNNVKQKIRHLDTSKKHSFSGYIYKIAGEEVTIVVKDNGEVIKTWSYDTASFNWTKIELPGIVLNSSEIDIEIQGKISLCDFMFSATENPVQWTPAVGELLTTQTNISQRGITVKGTNRSTIMSPLEFSGYNGTERVFTVNEETTISKKFEAQDEINMKPIKIIPFNTSEFVGWKFVKME